MSDSTPIITAILLPIAYLGLILGIWYWRYRKTANRINTAQKSSPQTMHIYRARYGSDVLMGELYITKNEIRFEKDAINVFSTSPQGIEKVVYNKRSIQFHLKGGQNYVLRYLHPSVEKEGVINYWTLYSVAYNDPETLKILKNELDSLDIQVIKGSTGMESPYFYFAIACAIFAFGFIVIMAVAKFIFDMDSFWGISL